MKKITLLLILFAFQFSFSQVYFEDNFDGSGPGLSGGYTIVDNDGQTPNSNVSFITNGWNEIDRMGADGNFGGPAGNEAAFSTSWYSPAGASDDWLITPAIVLPANANATLRWTARALDASFPDGYEVRISTTGTNITTDFSTILFSTTGENASNTVRTVDLSTYNGQTIYVAWRNNSNDQFLLAIDDIFIGVPMGNPPAPVITPSPIDMATGVAVDPADNDMDGNPDYGVTLSWDNTSGSTPDEYDIFYGSDSAANMTLLGTTPNTSVTITGNFENTTYFWQIVAKNNNGSAMGSSTWSFTTAGTTVRNGDPSAPTPTDNATNVVIDTADNNMDGTPDNSVTLMWTPSTTGDAADSYNVSFGQDMSNLPVLGGTAATSVDITGLLPNTTYFWRIQPVNRGGINSTSPTWQFTTDATASIDGATLVDFFSISPNPASSFLNVNSEVEVTDIVIYNSLGQIIQSDAEMINNKIDVSNLKSGMYFIKANSDKNTQTIKFIKN